MISYLKSRRKTSRGIALIFVLALVVILTTFVLVILSRATLNRQISFSSVGQQRADQIARGSLPILLNDFRQEISAGSRPAVTSTYAITNVYIPTSNQTIVPAYAGYAPTVAADPFPNLLKRSAVSTPFFPNSNATLYNFAQYPPSDRASALNSSADPAIDGRYINATRWNKPMLMDPTKLGASPLNSAALYGNFTPPDWTLVTRSGPQVFTSWNSTLKDNTNVSNFVIGRYAYMIYDEGGLLDINEAGYSSTFAADFDKSSKRGRLGQADLTALPPLSQSDVDKIVSWRNAATSITAPAYFDFLFHGSFSSGVFQYNQTDAASAFRAVMNGDQTYTSRQDLIAFFNFTFGNNSTQSAALPFLGTFSRERNVPSYCPPNPVGTSSNTLSGTSVPAQFMYANNAELTASINRNFPTIRIANSGTLPDGTLLTAGDPLIRRRFPLSRLQLVETKADNPTVLTHDADIKRYFGLVYDQTSGKWTYTSPDSNSVATSIKTLAQVAQLSNPREADFFELLQAGILNGSLGKTAGVDTLGHSTSGSETVTYDSQTDFQVIQIGANIIDQYDADNVPTTITYGGTPSGAQGPDFYDFYGIENMPYISKISDTAFRLEKSGLDPFTTTGNPVTGQPWKRPFVASWLQFELWNPHQNPEYGSQLPLRIYAVGTAGVMLFTGAKPDGSYENNGGVDFTPWPGYPMRKAVSYGMKTFDSSEYISVPSNAYALADYFRDPHTLTPDLQVTVSNSADRLTAANVYSASWDFIGFKTGEAFASSDGAESNNDPYAPSSGVALNPAAYGLTAGAGGITFYLQCENPPGSGNWKTIQRVKNCVLPVDYLNQTTPLPSLWTKTLQADASLLAPSHSQQKQQSNAAYAAYLIGQNNNLDPGTIQTEARYRMLPDPRTDRFGVFESFRARPTDTTAGPEFNETAQNGKLANARGFFGRNWSYGRSRTPVQYQGGQSWSGPQTQYPTNGWFDGRSTIPPWVGQPLGTMIGLLQQNRVTPLMPLPSPANDGSNNVYQYFYADPDGIVRGGDGYYSNESDQDGNGYWDSSLCQMNTTTGSPRPERPLVLNRPFRSVGELGYVHRGEPWKSLDFFTSDSADAGLLDLFTIDEAQSVAGIVDLNTRQRPVIESILKGAIKSERASSASDPYDPVINASNTTDASSLADLMVSERLNPSIGPLLNKSELVTRFMGQNQNSISYTQFPINKTRREAVVRPLAAVGNTRTWNLLIDIIAQSGRYPINSTNLKQFQIEGEKRYWWHLAIDRFTGEVVDSQLEPVYE